MHTTGVKVGFDEKKQVDSRARMSHLALQIKREGYWDATTVALSVPQLSSFRLPVSTKAQENFLLDMMQFLCTIVRQLK